MIKDATGVDLTTAITGAIRISTVFDQYANTARKIPKNIAKRNPVTIRTKLNPTDCQKFPVKLSSKSFRTTETGDARRISCPRYILANCQIVIQKNTATMRIPV
jgi:hypothetical protein